MAIKIFFGNYKGGVGKTTSVFQVGINMAQKHNKNVLLLDLDPQASLSKICMKWENISLDNVPIESTLNYLLEIYTLQFRRLGKLDILSSANIFNNETFTNLANMTKNAVKTKKFSNGSLSFIPTRMDIANARINDIADQVSRYSMGIVGVAKLIEDIEKTPDIKPDYILIDCPPSLNAIIQAVFLKSNYYIIPTIADDISISGVMDYIKVIEKTVQKYTYDSAVGGILLEKMFSKPPKLIGIFETMAKAKSETSSNDVLMGLNMELYHNNIEELENSKPFTRKIAERNYILSEKVYHRDNRSNPNDYGIPYKTSRAEYHDEYDKITTQIIKICEQ